MWASVTEGEPTLTQLWFKALCRYRQPQVLTRAEWILASTDDTGPTFNRHCVGVGLYLPPAVCTARPSATSAGSLLGHRRRRWARIGTALGQRLVFSGSVDRPHFVSHIAGCEDTKTVAQMIEPKDDLVAVDIKNGVHHIKIHSLYCPQEPLNNINYKSH